MLDEETENLLDDDITVRDLGFINYARFLEHKHDCVEGLIQFGGSFCQAIGQALYLSDRQNAIKILRYWAQECDQHKMLYKACLAKKKSEEENITGPTL